MCLDRGRRQSESSLRCQSTWFESDAWKLGFQVAVLCLITEKFSHSEYREPRMSVVGGCFVIMRKPL